MALLLPLILTAVASANPGIKMSQDASSFARYLQSILPALVPPISISDLDDIYYKSPLGYFRTMDVNLTNIKVSNIYFGNATVLQVSLVPPNRINLLAYNFTGSVSFHYSILGKGLSISGTGTGIVSNSVLILNSTIGTNDGLPALTVSVPEMTIRNVTLTLTPIPMQLYTDMQTHLATSISEYITTNATSRYQTLADDLVATNANRWTPVNSMMVMDSSWTQAPLIVANATSEYIVMYINGTIVPNNTNYPGIDIAPAVAMPDRLPGGPGEGGVNYMISQYTLESYMWSCYQYNNAMVSQTSLPLGFPFNLSTSSGYFPEIAQKYGQNTPLQLNLSLISEPKIGIDPRYGIYTSLRVQGVVILQQNSVVSFSASILYFSSLYISKSMFQGFPLSPVVNLESVTSTIGQISNYYLGLFIKDFFTGAAKSSWNVYMFPAFPLLVTPQAAGAHFVRQPGYLAIDL